MTIDEKIDKGKVAIISVMCRAENGSLQQDYISNLKLCTYGKELNCPNQLINFRVNQGYEVYFGCSYKKK